MSFVEQEDVLNTFENLMKHLFKSIKNIEFDGAFPRMTYAEAMETYGSDKPDIRFGMEFKDLNAETKNKGFKIFDEAEAVIGINAQDCAIYTRKQLDKLTDFVRKTSNWSEGLSLCEM